MRYTIQRKKRDQKTTKTRYTMQWKKRDH
jgi:hypothetical protein